MHRTYVIERLVKSLPAAPAGAVVMFQTDTHTGLKVEGGVVTKKEVAAADTILVVEPWPSVLKMRGTFSLLKMTYGEASALPALEHVAVDVRVEPRWMGDAAFRRLKDLVPTNWNDVGPRYLILLSSPPLPAPGVKTEPPANKTTSAPSVPSIPECTFIGPIGKDEVEQVLQVIQFIREHPQATIGDGKGLLQRDGAWFRALGQFYLRAAGAKDGTFAPQAR